MTYVTGLLLEKPKINRKLVVGGSFSINLLILAIFKYYNFFISTISDLCGKAGIEVTIHFSDSDYPKNGFIITSRNIFFTYFKHWDIQWMYIEGK